MDVRKDNIQREAKGNTANAMELTGEPMRETYVKLFIPDGMFSKSKTFRLEHRNPYGVATPPEVVGIQFYDIISQEIVVDGESVLMESAEFDPSPLYFIRGKKFHLSEFAEEYPDMSMAVSNAERFDNNYLIKFGGFITGFDPEKNEHLRDYTQRTNNGQEPEDD